jgi:hypothetical protein
VSRLVAGLVASLVVAGCATTMAPVEQVSLARQTGSALVAVECAYQECPPWFPPPSAGPIVPLHSSVPRCLEVRQSRAVDWCASAASSRARVEAFMEARRAQLTSLLPTCEAQPDPPESRPSILAAVQDWVTNQHGDALSDTEEVRTRVNALGYPLSALVGRCWADALWRARNVPRELLSDGEALLCAEISPTWAGVGLAAYWPQLANASEGT